MEEDIVHLLHFMITINDTAKNKNSFPENKFKNLNCKNYVF